LVKPLRVFIIATLLLAGRLSGQMNPPDLRCIEVLANGDVKLTWIPPADPSNLFFAYEIWYAPITGSTYTPLPSPPTQLSNNSYVHVGGNAGYYYVFIRFGPGGNSSTLHSDTLRTIFLNILTMPGAADIKLIYNDTKRPRQTTATTYTLFKEFPSGTWNTLATTPLNSFADTIAVCSASINYQVKILDQSGCFSISNLQGGKYSDQKSPNIPYIDSVSVLPNGQSVIAWRVPYDKDIKYYEIQYGTNSQGGSPIDTVKGRLSTFYTYTNTIATQTTVILAPKAIDSCGNGSVVDYNGSTIFLKARYFRCDYSTELTWSAYSLRPGEVREYQVMYSVNGGAYKQVGSTTSTTFLHVNADPGKNLSYFIRMISTVAKVTSSSNRIGFFSSQVGAPDFVYVACVSVTGPSEAQVTILLDTGHESNGVDLYRSEDGATFSFLRTLAVPPGNPLIYATDEGLNTAQRRYYYKAVIRDSCGNARTVSNIVPTILLRVTNDAASGFVRHLNWTPAEGFAAGVSGYYIFRFINDNYNVSYLAAVSSGNTAYADNLENVATEGASVRYMVQAVESLSNPHGYRGYCNSNIVTVYTEDAIFIPNAFTPNGENPLWKPVTHFVDLEEYRILVYDRWGKKVFETRNQQDAWSGEGCSPDIYNYIVTYRNAAGEYKQKTGNILLLE
jgi:gliding motility-associated-like protein